MKLYKNLLKIGIGVGCLALLLLAYNFFSMYGIVGMCPDDINAKPCQAYDNWALLNNVGFVALAVGIAISVVGLVKRLRQKL